MSDPQRQAPPERPDPSALLIDAVIQRQSALAERLAQQWVHRRGWPSLDSFVKGPLLRSCGPEALDWLRQRLGLDTPGTVLREALAEAIAPLRPSAKAAAPLSVPTAATDAEDPWELPALRLVEAASNDSQADSSPIAASTPAPPPADLAGLRAWLQSDAA